MRPITAVALGVLCLTLTVRPGHVVRVHDGDTFFLYDLNPKGEEGVRLAGVDAFELNEPRGPDAKAFTVAWLARGPFQLTWCKREKYGRLLGMVSRGGEELADALEQAGLVKP